MRRIGTLALALSPCLALAQSPLSAPAPVLGISLYAPIQKDPPVHIVSFRNDGSEVQFVLSNDSDKPVIGVGLGFVEIAPPGCAAQPRKEPEQTQDGYSAGGFPVGIAPHGQAVASGVGVPVKGSATPQTALPHYPKMLVHVAQAAKSAYIQTQVGVIGVWFEDGSTWPANWRRGSPPNNQDLFFDRSLVEAESGKCADVPTVSKALRSVKEVVFNHEGPQAHYPGDDAGALPHLRFTCSLQGPKAVCRMPVETGHTAIRSAGPGF
jgi:hypothetical protein